MEWVEIGKRRKAAFWRAGNGLYLDLETSKCEETFEKYSKGKKYLKDLGIQLNSKCTHPLTQQFHFEKFLLKKLPWICTDLASTYLQSPVYNWEQMEMTSIFNNRDLVKEIMIKEEKNKLWYGHIVNY